MTLQENGTQVLVTTLNGKKKLVNISDFSLSDSDTYRQMLQVFGSSRHAVYPLNVEDKVMMLEKQAFIHDVDVFKAICNGYEIDLSKNQDEKGESKIIDV